MRTDINKTKKNAKKKKKKEYKQLLRLIRHCTRSSSAVENK